MVQPALRFAQSRLPDTPFVAGDSDRREETGVSVAKEKNCDPNPTAGPEFFAAKFFRSVRQHFFITCRKVSEIRTFLRGGSGYVSRQRRYLPFKSTA
jgi:hypothetical protein